MPSNATSIDTPPRAGEIVVGAIALAFGTLVIYGAIAVFVVAGLFGARRHRVVR